MEIFSYDNILLLPRKCRAESRSACDAGVTLGGRTFRIPVVPANMKTVVNQAICVWLAQNGYFCIMHRFDLDNVRKMIGFLKLKRKLPSSFIIAGNVATPEAVINLETWGADATKVGVGPGKVCITKLKTGFGTGGWQLSLIHI